MAADGHRGMTALSHVILASAGLSCILLVIRFISFLFIFFLGQLLVQFTLSCPATIVHSACIIWLWQVNDDGDDTSIQP